MKMLIVACALCLPLVTLGQSVPVKGANVVIINTQDSASTALRKLALCFAESGNMPDNSDAKLGYITSRATKIGNTVNSTMLTINGSVSGIYPAVITLNGTFSYSVLDGPAVSAKPSFEGSESAPRKRCFREMERVAKLYPGGVITYVVR